MQGDCFLCRLEEMRIKDELQTIGVDIDKIRQKAAVNNNVTQFQAQNWSITLI